MLPYWIAAALTALVSVVYAWAFRWAEGVSTIWHIAHPSLAFVIVPVTMIGSMCLAKYLAPGASGSGIPQLMAADELTGRNPEWVEKLLSLRIVVVKFIGSCLSVAGGGIIGREGPMLQISASLFRFVQQHWPERERRPSLQSMILAGGAAGLAAAFNTPLGGVIFAVEELAKIHVSQIRTNVFHAVIIAGLLAQAFLGNYLYFGKIEVAVPNVTELVPLILAAAAIGAIGAVSGAGLVYMADWRAKMKTWQQLLMTALLGLAVASMIYFLGDSAMGSGRHVIVDLVDKSTEPSVFLAVARVLGNFMTYAGGVIGGVFAPSLASGAAIGAWLATLFDFANPHLWIVMGMAAFLTGVTRTPFTSLILVLEMTDTHGVILQLMIAAIVAQSAAKMIDPISFYEHMSERFLHNLGVEVTYAADPE